MISNRFIAIGLILILMEPFADCAIRYLAPSKANDIWYDEETKTERKRNQMEEQPQCPQQSSTLRQLLAATDKGAATAVGLQLEYEFVRYGEVVELVIPDAFMGSIGRAGFEDDPDAIARFTDYISRLTERRPVAGVDPELSRYAFDIYQHQKGVITNDGASRLGPARLLIVVGDPHGAGLQLFDILQQTGLVDLDALWIGENTILVIMGDLIHRGPYSAWLVFMVFYVWQPSAPNYVSNVIVLFGNHELQQMWWGHYHIALRKYAYGVEGGPYAVPDDHQIDFLQNPLILRKIKQNSLMIARIRTAAGKQILFHHCGFRMPLFYGFFGDLDPSFPEATVRAWSADEAILRFNLHSRAWLIRYSNQKLAEIVRDRSELDETVYNTKREPWAEMKERLQHDPSDRDYKGITIFVDMAGLVTGGLIRERQEAFLKEDFKAELIAFSEPILTKFGANILCVGHYWGQKKKVYQLTHTAVDIPEINDIGESRQVIFTDLGMFEAGKVDGAMVGYFEMAPEGNEFELFAY